MRHYISLLLKTETFRFRFENTWLSEHTWKINTFLNGDNTEFMA